jgi:hypothetical protein
VTPESKLSPLKMIENGESLFQVDYHDPKWDNLYFEEGDDVDEAEDE